MEDTRLLHWYCGQDGAEELRGLSVLLVKLFSYKRVNEIDSWRNHHDVLVDHFRNGMRGCWMRLTVVLVSQIDVDLLKLRSSVSIDQVGV